MLPNFRRVVKIGDDEFIIARARKRDIKEIQALYDEVYEGKFTLPEIIQRRKMEKIMYRDDHLWVVAIAEADKRICASYIFALDLEKKIGKLYAAVVHPDFRGKDLMVNMIKTTKKFLEKSRIYLDTVYATFRTVSLAPRKVLSDLGFKSLGIFPNVHRVDEEETHGLQAWFSEESMKIRRSPPFLLPEMEPVYDVIREQLGLEEAVICEEQRERELKFNEIHQGESVKRLLKASRDKHDMYFDFFPLHEPSACFECTHEKVRAFIYIEPKDGHSCITAIQAPKKAELTRILKGVIMTGASMRMDYIELLVSAYDIQQQKAALDSGFLPCAYYPAFDMADGERLDYIVCAYSSRDINFSNVKLFETDRQFIDAYLSNTKYRNILPTVYSERKKRKG
ncbi:MAG: hypothetical protein PHQ23_00610 [Candidatus Wallbacteria bacterium]|nr:hypothetical protein [Candidatus Wallbacteria bacterium]